MRLNTLTCICILFLAACASPTQIPTPEVTVTASPIPQLLSGTWMGSATQPNGEIYSLVLDLGNSKLNIEPFTKTWDLIINQTANEFSFTLAGGAKDIFRNIEFTGTFTPNVIMGSYGEPGDTLVIRANINWDGVQSESFFVPVQDMQTEDYSSYEGLYRFESGRGLSVIVSPEFSTSLNFFSKTLMLTDFESGALRSLYPLDDSTFLIGALRVVGAPFDGRVEFIKDAQGNVNGLIWWDAINANDTGEFAERVQYTIEDDISFISADGTKLVGRLSLPESDAPVPAIMGLHGSEPGTRDNFGAKVMAHYMLSQGIAILNYDKRGAGESEGVYKEWPSPANLQNIAEDAIAGVQYLTSRPEIDAKKIGLIGFSQAGWVMPLAASQSQDISFIVALSSPVESTFHDTKFNEYTHNGNTVIDDYDDAFITQQLRETKPSGFDSIPLLSELNQKGLWLWGSVDKTVPATFCAENLQAIIDSGKDNFSYQILPNGDHNLNFSEHGYFNEIPYSPNVLFYEPLAQWLEENILSK